MTRRGQGQFDQRQKDPLYGDVKYGSGGRAGGKFVMNDGQPAPVYNFNLLQENGLPLLQESGLLIYLD